MRARIPSILSSRSRNGAPAVLSAALVVTLGGGLGIAEPVVAAPTYSIAKVLVAEDQYQGEAGVTPKPLYKPHEVAIDGEEPDDSAWITSNEREGFAGITIFNVNKVEAFLNIEEPGLEFAEELEEETIGNVEEEEGPVENFPPGVRMRPKVCLPVQLPASDPRRPKWNGIRPKWYDRDKKIICAPLGAEMHARHPHGIDVDHVRKLAHQVIEHSGLKWNADRTKVRVADNTDEEAGMLLIYDISGDTPKIVNGYLLGHGAHELAVNDNDGRVWQGNHEDSPNVTPNIWVDVIDPSQGANGYGFIDTGWYNAVQGIEVDENTNQVFGTTHVGEKMFAFDGGCTPLPNAAPNDEKQVGENCILYSVDLRQPFLDQVDDAQEILDLADSDLDSGTVLPSVLHMHDLTVDKVNQRAYQTLHSIHHAEHTGSPEEAALPEPDEGDEVEPEHHFMGRWVAEVDVDSSSPTFKQVTYIDLSNGQSALDVPNAEDVPEGTLFEDQFVHAHWVAVDPDRGAVLVTGEHTGNLGVVDNGSRNLEQVLPISIPIPNCEPELDEEGNPEFEEPHVHGVQVDLDVDGNVYVSDEGEHCFYESVIRLKP